MTEKKKLPALDDVKRLINDGRGSEAAVRLKTILLDYPEYTAAIALLGQLQFSKPLQPVNDFMQHKLKSKVAEVVVELRNPCNYRCNYCVAAGKNNVPVQTLDLTAIEDVYRQLDADVVVTAFECEGGEPTIHPQFAELVAICAKYGAVSFPTNNSQKPERWLPKEYASRLYIRSALHPEAEASLSKYCAHAQYLIEAGCDFACLFIAHPERMSKIGEYAEYFASRNIPFFPSAFIGEHDGKKYPHAYSAEEKETLKLNETNTFWGHKIQPHTNRIRNFRGIPCYAGNKSIYISKSGRIARCLYDRRPLEKVHDVPQPCDVSKCCCGLLLEKLSTLNSDSFHAFWAEKAGKAPADVADIHQFAKESGYRSLDEALAHEGADMYDELMRAYGKDGS